MSNKITLSKFTDYVKEAVDELLNMIESYGTTDNMDEDSLFVRTMDNLEYYYKIKTGENGIRYQWITDYWNEPSIQSIIKDFEERAWEAFR